LEDKDLLPGGPAPGSRPGALSPYRIAAIALVAGHFLFLTAFFEPAISTPDANGYFAQARLIAEHGRTWFEPESPLQYVGGHWLKTESGRYFSRYPPGLPAVLAAAYKLGPAEAALLVNPLLTSLTLLGISLLCALWIGEGWGLAAAAAMALNPVANTFALAGDSHAATAFFLVWGLYLTARWSKSHSPSTAFFTGLCLGVIPTIRYPEVLFGPAVGLYMLLHWNDGPRAKKSLATAVLGALIPVSFLLIRNHLAFGAFWKTGYSLTHEQTGFSLQYFIQNAVPYMQNILGEGLGLFTALGLVGMVLACVRRETRRQGILLLGLVLPVTLLYMAYYFAPSQMSRATLRFLLPTFYIYTLAGVWCLKIIAENRPRGAIAAALAVLAATLCWGLPQSLLPLARFKQTNASLAAITDALKDHAEAGSIVIAGPQVQQHLDFIGRWRLADESVFQGRIRRPMPARRGADSDRPHPMQHLEERLETRLRYQNSSGFGLSERLLEDLKAWALPERKVYWIGSLEEIEELVPAGDSLNIVARIELPRFDTDMPGMAGRFGGMPGAMMPGSRRARGGPMGGGMGGNIQMRLMQLFAKGEELALVEWSWTSDKKQ